MSERPDVTISLSHDAAMVLAGVLSDYFYGGAGPLQRGRLSGVQACAFSEFATKLEDVEAVSAIWLGDRFVPELEASTRKLAEQEWPDD
ncbi:MAG: hypothetical protein AB7J28_08955 [Hyphomonadaceae bacterium]